MKTLSKTELAIANARTVFATTVKNADRATMGKTETLLKKSTNVKLGKKVTKGKLAGFPIYTLTLEELATCPRSCAHWADCYGNNMPFATRYAVGAEFENMLADELAALQKRHPKGFLVRLHILGDFYSVGYVAKWGKWLAQFPALHIYGYTANQPDAADAQERAIGQAVLTLRNACGDRFAIRFSGNFNDATMTANSADDARAMAAVKAKQAFICPVQTDRVADCGSCTLCWASRKPVVFITH
jgi:hypothetical protein